MTRMLPAFLILLIVAGAWRRDAGVWTPEPRTPKVLKPAALPTIEEYDVAAPVVVVRSSPSVRPKGEDRERQLAQRVTALEGALQEALEKVDEHRAKLAKSLNEKGLAVAEIEYARRLAERLQQDLELMETAYVEHMAQHRRSD